MIESTVTPADGLAERLLDRYASRIAMAPCPFLLGISGLQGSGKSTLARAMTGLAARRGWPAATLSLDDVYLTHAGRQALARTVHPLLATRGVPGTHDAGLLRDTLDGLGAAAPWRPALVPRFDKGLDDRMPRAMWPVITTAPRLIVLEGWCLGVPAEDEDALVRPLNALERNEDVDRRWRRWVNSQLAGYAPLWQRLDSLVALQAPDWQIVRRWRGEAERPLRASRAPQAMDAAALDRFLQHYERISRHALASLSSVADLCLMLDENRHVRFSAT